MSLPFARSRLGRRLNCRSTKRPGQLRHPTPHRMRRSLDMASAQIARFIEMNPDLEIADSPLKDWIKWDSGMSVADYCAKISQGSQWGGGIEMAAVAELKKVHVLVYEQVGNNSSSFKRIGAFGSPKWKAVRILYQVHALNPKDLMVLLVL